jgi:hypothetical protein
MSVEFISDPPMRETLPIIWAYIIKIPSATPLTSIPTGGKKIARLGISNGFSTISSGAVQSIKKLSKKRGESLMCG